MFKHNRAYNLYPKTKTKLLTLSTAVIMLAASIGGVLPVFFSQNAGASNQSEVVYNATPSVTPQTNYPSLGYEATSTSEFGDKIQLGGTNRVLNTVTVTMSNWAKHADYASNPVYADATSWSLPVTLNVYGVTGNNTLAAKLASVTQTVVVPWRPASDPSCGNTSNGTGWKIGDTCYNYSGIAFNASFDLSSLSVTLPNEVIVSVAYNTQHHGSTPTGVSGPYNSLNVAVPENQAVTTGSDIDTNAVFLNSTSSATYRDGGSTGVFRNVAGWAPNGTVALTVTALAPAAPETPTNLGFGQTGLVCGSATNTNFISPKWDAVSGASSYEYRVTLPNGSVYGPVNVGNVTMLSGPFGAEGRSTFSVRAVGSTGLTSAWAPECAITYDATAPTTPTLLTPVPNGFTKTNDFYFTWTASSDATAVTYQFQSDGNGSFVSPWDSVTNGNSEQNHLTTPTIHSTGAPDGTYYWRVRAIDAAGNTSGWSTARKMTIDTVAPVVTTSVQENAVLSGTTAVLLDTTGEVNPQVINIRVLNATTGAVIVGTDGKNQGAYSANETTTSYTYNWDTTKVADGTYKLQFSARDAAGNSATAIFRTVTVKNSTLPVVPVTPPTTPVVLGDTTTTPSSASAPIVATLAPTQATSQRAATASEDSANQGPLPTTTPPATAGVVKSATTTRVLESAPADTVTSSKNTNKLLGLGWAWLPILALIAGFFWLIIALTRRKYDDERR